MKIKSIFFSLALLFSLNYAFAGTGSADEPLTPVTETTLVSPTAEGEEMDACTINSTIETGGQTIDVTVTADDCASAMETLSAIAKALDEQ